MSDPCHPSHRAQLNRINRIVGQLEGVKTMVEEQRYCIDILNQLKAIRSAVKSLESNILESHLESCVSSSLEDESEREAKLKEIIDLFKKLD